MAEKVEFGSDAWMDLATQTLLDVVHEAAASIAGERLTISEVFVDPPAHLRRKGSDVIAWSLEISDGTAKVFKAETQGADYSIRADYQSTLPGARAILGTSPDDIEARLLAQRERVASGLVQQSGGLDHVSPAMRAVLFELHNRLARRTA